MSKKFSITTPAGEEFTCTASSPASERFILCALQSKENYVLGKCLWVERLQRCGVAGSHADDGWVNRAESYITPSYPEFWNNPQAGSVIALGDHEDFRLVRVWEVRRSELFSSIVRYYFRSMTIERPEDLTRTTDA